jgi:hypothetical protein
MAPDSTRESAVLTLETTKPPWYLNLEPINRSYMRRKASRILSSRGIEAAEVAWIQKQVDHDLLAKVSQIIAEQCEWPNPRFVPEDRCSVILQGKSLVDASRAEAMTQIEEEVIPGLDQGIWSGIDLISYGELVERLQGELRRIRGSDLKVLAPDAFVIPWLMRHFSSYRNAYRKRRYSGFLFVRDHGRVEAAWIARNLDPNLVRRISTIVMRECQWPTPLFVPEDRGSIVFTGQYMQPNAVNVVMRLEEELRQSVGLGLWSEMDAMSYGEFVDRIRTVLTGNRMSGYRDNGGRGQVLN